MDLSSIPHIPKQLTMERLNVLIHATNFLLTMVVIVTSWLSWRWRLSHSKYWPITHGRVEAHHPSGENCLCLIGYSYSLNGEYYSGEMPIHKGPIMKSFDDVLERLPVGTAIEVRYRQNAPHDSVGVLPPMMVLDGFPQ